MSGKPDITSPESRRQVAVIIGMGGVGLAAARRIAHGRHLVVGTRSLSTLSISVDRLRQDGYSVDGHLVDIGDPEQVADFAKAAGAAGHIQAIVQTSGVSPVSSSTEAVLRVDLLGCANVIERFREFAGIGTSLVCVSSMSASLIPGLSPELERHLATAPVEELLKRVGAELRSLDPGYAYAVAKRANQLRVEGATAAWGELGARINTVSPGVVATRMGYEELSGPSGHGLRQRLDHAAIRRAATPDEIASAIDFLTGPQSSYITGTNLLVDGGCVAATRYPNSTPAVGL